MAEFLLFHDLKVDLLHVNLLIELWGEFCRSQELCIYAARHHGLLVGDLVTVVIAIAICLPGV